MTSFSSYVSESSVHGFVYTVRKSIHILERVFWLAIIIAATSFSIYICLDQWQRFKNNPIIYTVEVFSAQSQKLSYAGCTMCSSFVDLKQNEKIIQENWNIHPDNAEKFDYHMRFLDVLSKLTLYKLDTLKPYENDSSLKSINFLKILTDMRSTLTFDLSFNFSNTEDENYEIKRKAAVTSNGIYVTVMTEFGVCLTTSVSNFYQNPFEPMKQMQVYDVKYCLPLSTCDIKILPALNDGTYLTVYFHNIDNIMSTDSIKSRLVGNTTLLVELEFEVSSAEIEVRKLPIPYRKCRYSDESYLKYFKEYKPTFCKIECRINKALKLCNCKPYFYTMGPREPICDIKGLLCLSQTDWHNTTTCECLALCEELLFRQIRSVIQGAGENFEKSLLITLFVPDFTIQKRVVFSTDQLVVSFGGAASFFLGCNFMSFVEIVYFLIEWIVLQIKNLRKKSSSSKEEF